MNDSLSPLKLTLYGANDEIKRELTRSIVPWGITERALDLLENLEGVKFDQKGIPVGLSREESRSVLTSIEDFVIFVFDDALTHDEIKRYASLPDVYALFWQVIKMAGNVNPTIAPPKIDPKLELKKVRQGNRR